MLNEKSVLAVIPARGGSKGVPRKNIRPIAGRPLIHWTIAQAKASKYIDRLIVSSDDREIISVAAQAGCEAPFVRPAKLSQDDSAGMDVLFHAIEMVPGFDYLVELQPTSPLRTATEIDACIELCISANAKMAISVSAAEKSPTWTFWLGGDNRLVPVIESGAIMSRRQDLDKAVVLNGAIFVASCQHLQNWSGFCVDEALPFQMEKESSIDIDTETDFVIAEALLRKRIEMELCTDAPGGVVCR